MSLVGPSCQMSFLTIRVTIIEQETTLGTAGVLTEVALGSSGRFAAFDNLVTLTVRTTDGDERYGPFLPKGGYEDKAQCDSNLGPSPLLKHYLQMNRKDRGHAPQDGLGYSRWRKCQPGRHYKSYLLSVTGATLGAIFHA
jgi:hypothetical protein